MTEFKKRVCVDLDGVLASTDGWNGHGTFGSPISGGVEFCAELRRRGYEVVIFTSRMCGELSSRAMMGVRLSEIQGWLQANKIPYDIVWEGRGKPACTAYVDDRAVSCTPMEESNAFSSALDQIDRLDLKPI